VETGRSYFILHFRGYSDSVETCSENGTQLFHFKELIRILSGLEHESVIFTMHVSAESENFIPY